MDKLASLVIRLKGNLKAEQIGSNKLRIKAKWKPVSPRHLEIEITTKEILRIDEILRHAGTRAIIPVVFRQKFKGDIQ